MVTYVYEIEPGETDYLVSVLDELGGCENVFSKELKPAKQTLLDFMRQHDIMGSLFCKLSGKWSSIFEDNQVMWSEIIPSYIQIEFPTDTNEILNPDWKEEVLESGDKEDNFYTIKEEFDRLRDVVDQFLKSPQSKATLQALQNANDFYKARLE